MRRALRVALTGGLCCLTLVGCSSGDVGSPAEPPGSFTSLITTTPPTTTSTTPTTPGPPGEATRPVMPALAKEKSTAGAKAFVRYYIDALNYGFHSSHSRLLAAASAGTCYVCHKLVRVIDKNHHLGGYQVGGDWIPKRFVTVPSEPLEASIILVEILIDPGFYRASSTDTRHKIKTGHVNHEFRLRWLPTGWVLTDLRDA